MKRTRCDGATGDVAAFKGASTAIEPPQKLLKAELKYWNDITKTRNLADWTPADLWQAWNLSKLFYLLECAHAEYRKTQDPKVVDRIEKLTRTTLSVSSKIQIHAAATIGRAEDAVPRNKAQRQASNTLQTVGNFIKRPGVMQ